jgi:hypothetical protein
VADLGLLPSSYDSQRGLHPCPHCGAATKFRHASRRCPGYSRLWAGDAEQKLFRNLELVPTVLMVTITAPGSTDLFWDADHCAALGDHRCSGWLGCRVRPELAVEWNEGCRARWRGLWNGVQTAVRRELGQSAPLAAYVWEKQLRGVDHLHLALGYDFADRERTDRAVALLRDRVVSHGFGREFRAGNDRGEPGAGEAAAAYFAKYLIGSSDAAGKRPLHETVTSFEAAQTIIYVSRRLTERSGVTMRALRHKRWLIWRVDNLDGWLRYLSIEAVYEAVREGWWRYAEYREDCLRHAGLPPP